MLPRRLALTRPEPALPLLPLAAAAQTGAGKTFTMSGDLRHYQHRGLIPQSIHQVFREIDMRVDKMYKVHVSAVQATQAAGGAGTRPPCTANLLVLSRPSASRPVPRLAFVQRLGWLCVCHVCLQQLLP